MVLEMILKLCKNNVLDGCPNEVYKRSSVQCSNVFWDDIQIFWELCPNGVP